jgi:hypothetical protein
VFHTDAQTCLSFASLSFISCSMFLESGVARVRHFWSMFSIFMIFWSMLSIFLNMFVFYEFNLED